MSASSADSALAAIASCLPQSGTIPLHEPVFAGNEWKYVKDCLDTGWVSSVGSYVDRFEATLGEITGTRAIATVTGTSALHMCLILAGVGPGDEVIIPALTFVATANAVTYCCAVPHFADCADATFGIDPASLAAHLRATTKRINSELINRASGRTIRAVVAMHTFGHPTDLDALVEVCRQFDLVLIEDAAEALGSLYKGKHVGSFGQLAALSFNGNKTVTTGGGGAILSKDPELVKRAKHLATTARIESGWIYTHDATGYNYRMPNINAALGCAQLEELPKLIAAKRVLASRYKAALAPIAGVRFVEEPKFARSNYWLNTLDFLTKTERDRFLILANERGFTSRPPWRLMPELPMFADAPSMDLPIAKSLAARLVNVPSGPALALNHCASENDLHNPGRSKSAD